MIISGSTQEQLRRYLTARRARSGPKPPRAGQEQKRGTRVIRTRHRHTSVNDKRTEVGHSLLALVVLRTMTWLEARDPATGKTYYHNSQTGQVTWDRPAMTTTSTTTTTTRSTIQTTNNPPRNVRGALRAAGTAAYSRFGGPLLVMLLASIVVLIQAAIDCDEGNACTGKLAWALALSIVSVAFCLLWLFFGTRSPAQGPLVFALFMFAWWTAGVVVCTFSGPYSGVSNAYFAIWVAWLCSVQALQPQLWEMTSLQQRFASLGNAFVLLLAGSAIELGASIPLCEAGCESYEAWAISCGAVSLVTTLLLLLVPQLKQHEFYLAIFLVLWWCAGAGAFTFKRPFIVPGNGYFASWAALGGALLLLSPYV